MCKETKGKAKLQVFVRLFICLFFSIKCRASNTSNTISQKDILLCALNMTRFARTNLKHVSETHIFQNGTP